ncbi:hypothetical protein [Congregibacter sp.]|uniref:hypothetical protein n=1 Tax=Congregibacter sp. TaxID=2744308 RepID=UPI003858D63F
MKPWQQSFLDTHRLPESYLDAADRFFAPLAKQLEERRRKQGASLKVGLNGSQGSGKSTLGDYLCECLTHDYGLSAAALSLDDFYLTLAERQDLAATVHPLLKTRGVPGTHDVGLLRRTLSELSQASPDTTAVPRFDKSIDDRAPISAWSTFDTPVDVIILEGWCLGARSELPVTLEKPCNALERDEDGGGLWRGYSNRLLKESYEPLYAELDIWVMLAAPGFEQVLRWRSEQEQKLREAVGGKGEGLMDDASLRRFVQYFERYTRQCLRDLPERADVLFQLDEDRRIVSAEGLEQTR